MDQKKLEQHLIEKMTDCENYIEKYSNVTNLAQMKDMCAILGKLQGLKEITNLLPNADEIFKKVKKRVRL